MLSKIRSRVTSKHESKAKENLPTPKVSYEQLQELDFSVSKIFPH
jgi:hypothetical protein